MTRTPKMPRVGMLTKTERSILRMHKIPKGDKYRKQKSRLTRKINSVEFRNTIAKSLADILLVSHSEITPEKIREQTKNEIYEMLLTKQFGDVIKTFNDDQKEQLVFNILEKISLRRLPEFVKEVSVIGADAANGRQEVSKLLESLRLGSSQLMKYEEDLTYDELKLLKSHLEIKDYDELCSIDKTKLKEGINWVKSTNEYVVRKRIERDAGYIFTNEKIRDIFNIIKSNSNAGIKDIDIANQAPFIYPQLNFIRRVCKELAKRGIVISEEKQKHNYKVTITKYGTKVGNNQWLIK